MSLSDLRIDGPVTVHPYRTATATDVFLQLPRDLVKNLEEALAAAAGVRVDNHTTYCIDQRAEIGFGEQTYVTFSDFTARFGRTIKVQRW